MEREGGESEDEAGDSGTQHFTAGDDGDEDAPRAKAPRPPALPAPDVAKASAPRLTPRGSAAEAEGGVPASSLGPAAPPMPPGANPENMELVELPGSAAFWS